MPRVREDFGYPPLVTPTSQIVGTQAVLNVLSGERYKMFTKESKDLLRGAYGKLPGQVDETVRKKAIGEQEVITVRPADLIGQEMDKVREECKEFAKTEEDVLSYAMLPQVATAFLKRTDADADEKKGGKTEKVTEVVKTLIVEDLTNEDF